MKNLICARCGAWAGKWRQFPNQDKGFGICRTCVHKDPDDLGRLFGIAGINYPHPHPQFVALRRYQAGQISDAEFIANETNFYLTEEALIIAEYAKIAGGKRYKGIHPILVSSRSDFKKLSPNEATFGGAKWILTECGNNIIKDQEYIYASQTN